MQLCISELDMKRVLSEREAYLIAVVVSSVVLVLALCLFIAHRIYKCVTGKRTR